MTYFNASVYPMTNDSLPLIGITVDDDHTTIPFMDNHFIPSYTLHKNLKAIIVEAGGIPIGILPIKRNLVPIILNKIDGIVFYKTKITESLSVFQDPSAHPAIFEMNLLQAAWEKNIPVLAIAGGAHYMTLFLQGELYENIHIEHPDALPHVQINPPHQGSHCVQLQPNSCLYAMTKRTNWIVNSFHQRGIKSPGQGIASAIAEDNTIEAIEDPSKNFFVGVQWHPEFSVDYTNRKLFSALTAKAITYAQTRL